MKTYAKKRLSLWLALLFTVCQFFLAINMDVHGVVVAVIFVGIMALVALLTIEYF